MSIISTSSAVKMPQAESITLSTSLAQERIEKEEVVEEESAVVQFGRKWKAFQNSFEQLNEALVGNLARSFGLNMEDVLRGKETTPEERFAVFGGKLPSAEQIARGIQQGRYQNIVVLCGAGVSTSAGISDFRSPDTGVYAQLKKEQEARRAKFSAETTDIGAMSTPDEQQDDWALPTPESLFTIDFYRQNQKPFILRAGHMWPGKTCDYRPTPSHCFLKLIEPYLLRVYTQNIDELETWRPTTNVTPSSTSAESETMLPRDKVRRCHGSFERVHCTVCAASYDRGSPTYDAVYQSMVVEGVPAACTQCPPQQTTTGGGGVMKPSIVFFGEAMSPEFSMTKKQDFQKCDLLIVMGTSLMVSPFSTLPEYVAPTVPRLLLNREVVGSTSFQESLWTSKEKEQQVKHTASNVAGDFLVDASKAAVRHENDTIVAKPRTPNYRDCALLGELDTSVHQLAVWMDREKALAAQCVVVRSIHQLLVLPPPQKGGLGGVAKVEGSFSGLVSLPRRRKQVVSHGRRGVLAPSHRVFKALPRTVTKTPPPPEESKEESRPLVAHQSSFNKLKKPTLNSATPSTTAVPPPLPLPLPLLSVVNKTSKRREPPSSHQHGLSKNKKKSSPFEQQLSDKTKSVKLPPPALLPAAVGKQGFKISRPTGEGQDKQS